MAVEDNYEPIRIAISTFIKDECDLLEVDANERSLTHKLAEHLQRAFPEWHVDCEYNRLGMAVKRLPYPTQASTDDTDGRTIFPDIIIHKRKTDENLLVIEVKKITNKEPGDESKLCGLTSKNGSYSYSLGLHLILDCANRKMGGLTAYVAGTRDESVTAALNKQFKVL